MPVPNHLTQTSDDLGQADSLLVVVHDDPMADHFVVNGHYRIQTEFIGDLSEDILIPVNDMAWIGGKGYMNHLFSLEELVRSDVHQTGRLAHTPAGGDHAKVSLAQSPVGGVLENAQRASLVQFLLDHTFSPVLLFWYSVLRVSAMLFGTLAYLENSMVNWAFP